MYTPGFSQAMLVAATALGTTSAIPFNASQTYSTWMATSFLSKNYKLDRSYVPAVLLEGIQKAGALHNDSALLEYAASHVSSLVQPNGTLTGWNADYYSLDDIRIGNNLLYWARSTFQSPETSVSEKKKYEVAAAALRTQLDRTPRNNAGGFWHRQTYPDQMWLDGIYMASTFYGTYTALFEPGNSTAWTDIARQFDLIEQHCRNATSGLLQHGYDESHKTVWADPVTGASPHVWIRAVGWYMVALVEVLQVLPATLLPDVRARLLEFLASLAKGVVAAQDPMSKGWWLIMEEPYPGAKGNYIESSGSAMFVYALLKGVRTGLLPGEAGEQYRTVAGTAYEALVERFVRLETNGTLSWEGTVQVGSLSGNASYQYYTSVPLSLNDGKGAAPFMYAATEYEMWKGAT